MLIIDVDRLISLVQRRPIIWDKTHDFYKERTETRNAWREVCREMRENFEHMESNEKKKFVKEVMKKWTNIRDAFHKCSRKCKLAKSGTGTITHKKYIYHDQLQFLKRSNQWEDKLRGYNSYKPETESSTEVAGIVKTEADRENWVGEDATKSNRTNLKRSRDVDSEEQREESSDEKSDRHMFFFRGILPSLNSLDEDEILEFQMEVLNSINSIKKRRRISTSNNTDNTSNLSSYLDIPVKVEMLDET